MDVGVDVAVGVFVAVDVAVAVGVLVGVSVGVFVACSMGPADSGRPVISRRIETSPTASTAPRS